MPERVKPSPKQLAYMDWEFGMFFHFGIRSFFKGHSDWDNKEMPASTFNPTHLSCDQWIRDSKAAGARYAILTAKHHDGFCNWPSKYTDYSVKHSPWKDGQGDVVAEFVAACRKYGLKVGLYCSPAQWGRAADFSDESTYDDYFINQLTELLTGYGEIDYLWFDGCGSDKHHFDAGRIVACVRTLQPNVCIFEMWDPDTRWVQNEDGLADMPNRNTRIQTDHTQHFLPGGVFTKPRFLPAECDFMMRDHSWFDCRDNADTVKSVEELMGIYELSVGRGANFLLNIGPDAEGRLPEPDAKRLLEFGEALSAQYGTPLSFSPARAEGEKWAIEIAEGQLVDRVVLREDIEDGEGALGFRLYAEPVLYPHQRNCLYQGATIGHKAICKFPAIRTKKLSLEITEQDGAVRIASMQAFGPVMRR